MKVFDVMAIATISDATPHGFVLVLVLEKL